MTFSKTSAKLRNRGRRLRMCDVRGPVAVLLSLLAPGPDFHLAQVAPGSGAGPTRRTVSH